MIIPYSFKLVHRQYRVCTYATRYNTTGATYPALNEIHVATHTGSKARSAKATEHTFWHEAVHAILHDMDDPLWKNEKFVTQFSERLVKLINTARFK